MASANEIPRVSVVVSTRDRAGRLQELLGGLRGQTLPKQSFEVVIVDDASSDGTAALLEDEVDRGELALRVLSRSSSGGAAIGREQGWRIARAPLIAFTDDDCLPDPSWLAAGLDASRANAGAILHGRTAPRPDHRQRQGPFSRTIDYDELSPHFPTTNIFYPRELLERVGGFDTRAFAGAVGGEDTDLAWRAIATGAEPVFCRDALVYHAINDLGPLGKLRTAGRQSAAIPFARHAGSRQHLPLGLFRKRTHFWLTLAAAGLALPGHARLAGAALALPYVRSLWARGRVEGGGPALAPYYLLHDLVEVYATVRGAARAGRLLI